MNPITVWVCVQVFTCEACAPCEGGSRSCEFQGVYSTESLAIAACVDTNYYIFPANLNEQLPKEVVVIEGGYYPMAEIKAVKL